MAAHGHWSRWLVLAAVCCCASGQVPYVRRTSMDLCETLPNVYPNGERLESPGDKIVIYTSWRNNTINHTRHCLMQFSTCNHCRLRVFLNDPIHVRSCEKSPAYYSYDGWCASGCSYLHFYDKFYSNRTARSYSTELWEDFRTESSFLYVIACANKSFDTSVLFNITIVSEEKTQFFKGSSMDAILGRQFNFSSPFFPDPYVLNSEVYHYVFEAATQDEFVTVSFDDWHLSQYSIILFDDASIVGQIQGSAMRPWVISNKYKLTMTFDTGPYKVPGTFRMFTGFKATFSFHQGSERGDIGYVMTSCGDRIMSKDSGNITFNPSMNGVDYYDCIWVIQKNSSYEKIMVQVMSFQTRDVTYRPNQPNVLEIREGLTSEGRLRAAAVASIAPDPIQTYEPIESSSGFYIRLKGHYAGRHDFVLSYTNFNYDYCRGLFICDNSKCISWNLHCDGNDNCGDDSDEKPRNCVVRRSTTLTRGGGPSAGAGSSDNYSVSVGIIIPLVVSIFLIVVVCLLIIFIRRCRHLSRQARRAQRHGRDVSTISGRVSCNRRRHNRRRGPREGGEINPGDQPPSYEDVLSSTPIGYLNLGFVEIPPPSVGLIQPPTYEEAISPTSATAPVSLTNSHDPDLSSDSSSSAETANRSQYHTSYSSDDTQASHPQRQRERRERQRRFSSSSDSSMEIHFGGMNQSESGERGLNSQQREQLLADNPNSRRSIAKPDDDNSVGQVVCLTGGPAAPKEHDSLQSNSAHPQDKENNRRNQSTDHEVITHPVRNDMTTGGSREPVVNDGTTADSNRRQPANNDNRIPNTDSSRNESHPASSATGADLMCRVENSPVILAPPSPQQQTNQVTGVCRSAPHTDRTTEERGDNRYSKASHNTPQHIRRDPRTHKQLRTPLKLLSRSMDDLRRHMDEDGSSSELASSRNISQSMENVFEGAGNGMNWELSRRVPSGKVLSCMNLTAASSALNQFGSAAGPNCNERSGERNRIQHDTPSQREDQQRPVPRPRRLLSGKAAGEEKTFDSGRKAPRPRPRSKTPDRRSAGQDHRANTGSSPYSPERLGAQTWSDSNRQRDMDNYDRSSRYSSQNRPWDGYQHPANDRRNGYGPQDPHISGSQDPHRSGSQDSHRSRSQGPQRSGLQDPSKYSSQSPQRYGSQDSHKSGSQDAQRSHSQDLQTLGPKNPQRSEDPRRSRSQDPSRSSSQDPHRYGLRGPQARDEQQPRPAPPYIPHQMPGNQAHRPNQASAEPNQPRPNQAVPNQVSTKSNHQRPNLSAPDNAPIGSNQPKPNQTSPKHCSSASNQPRRNYSAAGSNQPRPKPVSPKHNSASSNQPRSNHSYTPVTHNQSNSPNQVSAGTNQPRPNHSCSPAAQIWPQNSGHSGSPHTETAGPSSPMHNIGTSAGGFTGTSSPRTPQTRVVANGELRSSRYALQLAGEDPEDIFV